MNKKGKTIIGIIFLSLLVVSFFLVGFIKADDSKIYDDKTKTVTIKNETNSEIVKIKLLTPLDNKVPRGYRAVAKYEINSIEALKILISKMELYNKDSMKPISRIIDYKIKSIEQVEVNNYIQDCNEVISANGTYQNCTNKLNGSHYEDRVIWNDLNKTNFNKDEKIIVGIFTDVKKDDKVEWIPTFKIDDKTEIRVEEWASWEESYSVGLVAYYNLNETSGDAIDVVRGKHNATLVGTITQGVNGKNETGYMMGQSGTSCLNISDDDDFQFVDEYAFAGWFKVNDTETHQGVFSKRDGNVSYNHLVSTSSDLVDAYQQDIDGTATNFNGGAVKNEEWVFLVIQSNTTDLEIYVNGTFKNSGTFSNGIKGSYGTSIYLGCDGRIQYPVSGLMDEIGIWNRSLTASEISDMWNNGDGITYSEASSDSTSPNVTSLTESPTDPATYSSGATYEFNATVLDDTDVQTVLLEFDGTNYTATNLTADVYNVTFKDLSVGTFNYRWWANDSEGNFNNSETGSYTINKATPTGSLTSDLGWTINESQSVTIALSESQSGDGDLTYIIYRDNVDKGTGETWSPALGTYDYILNTTGGTNWTANSSMDTQTLTVNDVTNPDLSIVLPTDNSYPSSTTTDINYTVSDTNLQACWYSNDTMSENTTITCGENITSIVWIEGQHNITIWANDTSNNLNSSSITFTIDTITPIISTSIDNMHEFNFDFARGSANFPMNYSVAETNFQASNYSITYPNGSICDKNLTASQNQAITLELKPEDRGTFSWYIYANDSAGWFQSKTITFLLDINKAGGGTIVKTGEVVEEGIIEIPKTYSFFEKNSLIFIMAFFVFVVLIVRKRNVTLVKNAKR